MTATAHTPPDLATDGLPWQTVNDGVMGGVSSSAVSAGADGLRFSGTVRTEFNGGFASARRALPAPLPADVTAFALRVQADGHRYRLTVYPADRSGSWRGGITYHAEFDTLPGQTTEVTLPLSSFRASFRGRAVPDAPALTARDVVGLGLMLTKDGHRAGQGTFALSLQSLRAVSDARQ